VVTKKIIIIIIFLRGLGLLNCSGVDALPSFSWSSTISSSSKFVVESVFRNDDDNYNYNNNNPGKYGIKEEQKTATLVTAHMGLVMKM
jgi:hypothetical protein